MNSLGKKIASLFHAKAPQERKFTLNIAMGIDGTGNVKKVPVDFMVDRRGRARLLSDKELPKEVRAKYEDTILAAVLSITDLEVVRTGQGDRLRGPNGILEYEFVITLKDGTTGIPYRVKPFSRKREYGDLRNYILSDYLDGATISIKINGVNCELKNSELRETTRKVRRFAIYNLDGSQTVVYKTEARPAVERSIYHEYEAYRRLFIVRHLQPVKQAGSLRFSYSSFDSSEKTPWIPGTLAREDERDKRRIPPPQMGENGDGFFRNGFDVIADALPEAPSAARQFENDAPKEAERQLIEETPLLGAVNEPAGLKQNIPEPIMQLPMKNIIVTSAKQYENAGVREGKQEKGKIGLRADNKESIQQPGSLGGSNGSGGRRARKKSSTKPAPFSALTSFKAVIFDLDGVIVDSEMVHPRTFERALAKYGVKIRDAHWKRAYTGIGSYAIFEDLVKRYGINEDARGLVKKRNEIYLHEIQENKLPVIGGFREVHRQLAENGVKEAVASGGHTNHVEESLRSVGLRNMPFVAIEQVKRGKPSPEIFLKAARRLRVKPSECIVFEDSLSGVEAAARAGMPCVAISTTMPVRELRGRAALIVGNFKSRKLKRLLAVLLARRKKTGRGGGKAAPAKRHRQLRGKRK